MNAFSENSLYINLYDGISGDSITQNISIEFSSNGTEFTNYTTTGFLFIDDIIPGVYTITASNENYSDAQYIVTVSENSFQYLNIYLFNSTAEVTFTLVNKNTEEIIEDAVMTIQTYVNLTLTTIAVYESDITGRILFDYVDSKYYKFIITKTGYEEKYFVLDPITFSSYKVQLTPESTTNDQSDYAGINIYYNPPYFHENQNNELEMIFSSYQGELLSYGFNITFPNSTVANESMNVYGATLSTSFNISDAPMNDDVVVTYYYTKIGEEKKVFTFNYNIIQESEEYTFLNNKGNTYGLGLFERVLLANGISMLVGGSAFYSLNALSGGTLTLLIFAVFVVMGFIPLWTVLISIFVGIIIISWRSSQ